MTATATECTDLEKKCFTCFCAAVLRMAPLSNLDYCPNVAANFAKLQGTNLLASITTAIANDILVRSVNYLSSIQGYKSRTEQDALRAKHLFFALFLNSVIVQVRSNSCYHSCEQCCTKPSHVASCNSSCTSSMLISTPFLIVMVLIPAQYSCRTPNRLYFRDEH